MATIDISMFPKAYLELPMRRPLAKPVNDNLFDINLTLNEIFLGEKFDRLELTISVGNDDPRLRAIDIYNQYGGCKSIVVKHFPAFWPNGIIHKNIFPNWSNETDRVLESDTPLIEKIEDGLDYNGAMGLSANSIRQELSYSETSSTDLNGKTKTSRIANTEFGMLRGKEPSSRNDGKDDSENAVNRILVRLSKHVELNPGNNTSQDISITDHGNPLTSIEWVLKDRHPIPYSIYMIDYFYIDNNGTYQQSSIVGQLYNPDHLKAGLIISKVKVGYGGGKAFNYGIKVLIGGDSNGWSWETLTVSDEWNSYDIGQFVLLAKIGTLSSGVKHDSEEDLGWTIQPSSSYYWRNVIEFLRTQLP